MRILIGSFAVTISFLKLVLGLLLALYKQQSIDVFTQSVAGKERVRLTFRVFKAGNKPLENTDVWFHYLKGNVNLVGPKLVDFDTATRFNSEVGDRFEVAPGLITPYQVRRSSGIAHADERVISSEFARHATTRRRVQILFAAFTQMLMGNRKKGLSSPAKLSLFGVAIENTSMTQAVRGIVDDVCSRSPLHDVKKYAFVNADCVNKYVKDESYRNVLNSFSGVFADGIGLRIAARWHGARLRDNVNGTDMFPILCQELSKHKKRVFLFGGEKRVVQATANKLTKEFPGLTVVGALDGYSYNENPSRVYKEVEASGADILFVATGAPRQEDWIAKYANLTSVKVAIGVGGLFDFYSESVSRAPIWLREFSLEWVWRLLMQPRQKAYRYLVGNPLFLYRVLFSHVNKTTSRNVLEVA